MSLKDAMSKVGLKSTKSENEREQKNMTKVESHQVRRNFCEVCETTQPDVERFEHKNPRVDAEWICSNCADKQEIIDDFRVTYQSEFCKDGRYRRYYGHTRDIAKEVKAAKPEVKRDDREERSEKKYGSRNNNNRNRNRNNSNNKNRNNRNNNRNGNRSGNVKVAGNGNSEEGSHSRDNHPSNTRKDNHRRPNNRSNNRPNNRSNNRSNNRNNNNKPKAKYTIDEDGEKNFNC